MTDLISNNLHITKESEKNLGNDSDKNEDIVKTFQNLPENPEKIKEQAEKILAQKIKEKKEKWEIAYEDLLNKPGMTSEDNKNMEISIKFLIDNHMDTQENRKKLYAVNYGPNYREIGGVKFSREKFVPKVRFNDTPNIHGVFECEKKGIYKTVYNDQDEYYLTTDQYIDQATKQWITAIKDSHLRQALKALPGEFSDKNWYIWGNLLWNILDLSMPGVVCRGGFLCHKDKNTYLTSASRFNENNVRQFGSDECLGGVSLSGVNDARLCLYIVK